MFYLRSEFFIYSYIYVILGVFTGEKFFKANIDLCYIFAILCSIFFVCSAINITSLSFNRYVNICHHDIYYQVFSKRNSIILCVSTWPIAALFYIISYTGWEGLKFDRSFLLCAWVRLARRSYSLFYWSMAFVFPTFFAFVNYSRIYIHIKCNPSKISKNKKTIHITKGLFYSFVFFLFFSIPNRLVAIYDFDYHLPPSINMYTSIPCLVI